MLNNPVILMVVAASATIGFILIVLPAYQAYRRGYNPFVWFLAGILALNPIFVLVVLAMVPHRGRMRLREKYREELDRKLAQVRGGPAAGAGPARVDTHSVGDQATELPQRSIGDDQTRL